MIKGIIFDFDGLILDTEVPVFQAWQEVYEQYCCQLPLDVYAQCLGSSEDRFDPLAYLEERVGHKLENADAIRKKKDHRIIELVNQNPPMPGVEDLIKTARSRGLKMAIASSSDRPWVINNLNRLKMTSWFDCIITSDEVRPVKPEPDLFLTALSSLELQPSEAIVFEDSPNGILAANKAHIFCVAVPNELTRLLDTSHANLIIPSLEAMPLDQIIITAENHQ